MKGGSMNQQIDMAKRWNAKFSPGQRVRIDAPLAEGRTITRAEMRDGVAMVFIDAIAGPVPLQDIKPQPKEIESSIDHTTAWLNRLYYDCFLKGVRNGS
jgi:hypothetical protein